LALRCSHCASTQCHLTRCAQLLDWIAGWPKFHCNYFLVIQFGQFAKNIFVIDFTRAGLMAPGNIGNVDQAYVLNVFLQLFNEVSLRNLLRKTIVAKLNLRVFDGFYYLEPSVDRSQE